MRRGIIFGDAVQAKSRSQTSRRARGVPWSVLSRSQRLIFDTLMASLPPPQRHARILQSRMLLAALRYQSYYGRCIASARRLAGDAGANEKSWDRLLSWLRSQGLVTTQRRIAPDGWYSTNVTDLRGLWYALVRRLGRLLFEGGRVYTLVKRGSYVMVKAARAYSGYHEWTFKPFLPSPPGDTPVPWPLPGEAA